MAAAILHAILFASLLTISYCGHDKLVASYRFNVQLSDSYTIYWTFDIETKYIQFAIRVQTTGWVGFGLSPNGQMPRSDVVIGWVNNNGIVFFHDRFAFGRFTPEIDEEQNWFLISGKEENGTTILQFWRKFTSCDDHDMDITSGTARVLGSYHWEDPLNDDLNRMQPHSFKKSRSINLLKGLPIVRQVPSDSNSFTIRNINLNVSSAETTYWCSVHYLPYLITDVDILETPIYMYKVAPIITKENLEHVHHMMVFICPRESTIETDGICDELSSSFFGCFGGQVIAAWAVGGEDYIFPNDVAFPLGGKGEPFKILLEVHFDNPNSVNGIVDSSGIEFFYTKQKPLFEAGGISIAIPIVPLMLIPPKNEFFRHSATCLPSCTNKYFPESGVTVFASFLHTHLIGTALNVRHFRRNDDCNRMEELPPIDKNLEYDFDFQQLSNLPKPLQVLKGDAIRVDCFYNSMKRDRVTLGGESTRQEMCQALLYYYPKTPVTSCGSFPDPYTAYKPFLEKHLFNGVDDSAVRKALFDLNRDNYEGIRKTFDTRIWWNDQAKKDFQSAMDEAQKEREFCANDNNTDVGTPLRPIFVGADCPYIEPNRCKNERAPLPCCERELKVTTTATTQPTGRPCDPDNLSCIGSASTTRPAVAMVTVFLSIALGLQVIFK